MLVIAEWELDRIRENWQYYTGAAIDRGVHISHGTHYGYYKVAKEEDRAKAGTLVIRPEEAAVVKDIFRRRAQDQTYSGIAEWLNDEHPRPDGKRWHHQNIKRIIQNRIYTGEAFRGKRVNKDAHPCIVTDAEWRAANAVGDRRARRATDPELPILAGLLRCAGCRYAMRQVTSKYRTKDGKQHAIRSYVCGKKHGGGVCQSPAYVKAEDIESWVVFTFLYWYGESTRNPHAGRAVQDAEAKLAEASRRLREVMENDVLREAAPKAHLEDVVRRQRLVDEATEELIAARATVERQAPSLLALDWEDADTPTRHNLLTRGLDSIYIRRGDGPLMDRVWFCWQDDADRPVRGRSDYLLRPIEWPEPVTADELAATFISHGVDPVRAAIYAQSIVGGSSMAAANYPEWAPPHVERYGFVPADTQRALGYG
jgi:hypothetical protein